MAADLQLFGITMHKFSQMHMSSLFKCCICKVSQSNAIRVEWLIRYCVRWVANVAGQQLRYSKNSINNQWFESENEY